MPKTTRSKKSKAKSPKKEVKVPKKSFTLTFSVSEQTYQFKGKNIIDCVRQIKAVPLKTKGVLVFSDGEKSYQKLMFIPQMRRFFGNDVAKQILAKTAKLALGIK